MRKYIATILFGLTLATSAAACGGDDASCEKVVDHTISLLPAEMKGQLGDKKALVAQCEKQTSKEERKCALEAKSMEDLMKCKK